jgi:ferredoxin-nitrite reductase
MSVLVKLSEAHNQKPNKIEKLKSLKSPGEAFALIETYAKEGYESIPDEDKVFFLKCFGIFDKKSTPDRFMLRVRIPGGRLTGVQAEVIGAVAREFGRDYIDLTTRMQVELRYLSIRHIPEVLSRLEQAGITTYQTGIDNFRNIVGDPLDGIACDNVIESQPILLKLQEIFLKKEAWIGSLPRKFNTAILGSFANRANIYGHDCAFVLAQKNGCYGFNVYLGGKVGEIAQDADCFVTPEEAPRFMEALAKVYHHYGFRDNRNRNRLYFLIQEAGMEAVTAAVREMAGEDFAFRGTPSVAMEAFDPQFGRVALKDGSFAVHMVIPSGIFSGTDMIETARLARTYGESQIRLTVEQKLYICGVKQENMEPLLNAAIFAKYPNLSTPYFNNIVACAGTEHCSFGVIPNKPDAIAMAEFLSSEVPLEEGKIRMYWSACPKGCGLHGIGDIGFEGCKAKKRGVLVDGVHILLGGKVSREGQEGRGILKSVPLEEAGYLVKELMIVYRDQKHPGESFEMFESRLLSQYSSGALAFLMRYNAVCERLGLMAKLSLPEPSDIGKNEQFEIFHFGTQIYQKAASPAAPVALEAIILKMIDLDKNEAYQTFSGLLTDLQNSEESG